MNDKLLTVVTLAIHDAKLKHDGSHMYTPLDDAKAAIEAYEQHLKDEGKVIVDREALEQLGYAISDTAPDMGTMLERIAIAAHPLIEASEKG